MILKRKLKRNCDDAVMGKLAAVNVKACVWNITIWHNDVHCC
jgi:hypothetical protein